MNSLENCVQSRSKLLDEVKSLKAEIVELEKTCADLQEWLDTEEYD